MMLLFALDALVHTISSMISVHLLTILQAREIALVAAVALGAIVSVRLATALYGRCRVA
ncbi:MAG: hypothetical protein KF810_14770 [Rhizobiaceae bacterium]|nr:hypothetical protein [Rhizobiaceae bacterium]